VRFQKLRLREQKRRKKKKGGPILLPLKVSGAITEKAVKHLLKGVQGRQG